jgi:thiol:disulfide interchange protein DsbD
MIPILSSIIAGQGNNLSATRGFSLSLVYVLAMAFTYTIAGVIVGITGANLQIWFQNPWVISTFAAIFVLLSLSMFGLYELQMPGALQSKLNSLSGSQKQGSLVGTAVMGFLSALIVGPCVTAPLIGALLYIAETGDPVVGGIALFALSMGMGAPLLLVGTSAGKYLPKAGAWMEPIKAVFGVMLLGLAIWFLERIAPAQLILALSGALAIGCAAYLGAFIRTENASGWLRLRQAFAWMALVYGSILIVGASAGSKSLIMPLGNFYASSGSVPGVAAQNKQALAFQTVKGLDGLNAAILQASTQNKPVMVDMYADWCIACKELEAYTFSDSKVQTALEDFVLLKVDVTANDELDRALLKKLGIFGPPAILFYDQKGKELRNYRLVGFIKAGPFEQHIHQFTASSSLVASSN